MQPSQDNGGPRKGFLLVMAGAVALLVVIMLLLRLKLGSPEAGAVAVQSAVVPEQQARPVSAVGAPRPAVVVPTATLEEKLGLQVASVRLTAGGRALDVRYKVIDAAKAANLDTQANTVRLVNQATGAEIGTPQPPPPLELNKPTEGRVYVTMFPNPGGALKAGSKVTLSIGQGRTKDLTVE